MNINSLKLFPPATSGEYRTRDCDGQPYTCAGEFRLDSPRYRMRAQDLGHATSLSIDSDFCDMPEVQEQFGQENTEEGRKATKKALYRTSEMEVKFLMAQCGFVDFVINDLAQRGFPIRPNRVIFTGHGVCLIYWFPKEVGANDDSEWGVKRLKAIFNRFIAHHETWVIDAKAKDIGTRILPVPGFPHRKANGDDDKEGVATGRKMVAVDERRSHDDVADWAAIFKTWDDTMPSLGNAKRSKKTGRKGKATGGRFSYAPWNTAWGDFPAKNTRLKACPSCAKSGCRREDDDWVKCFSCMIKWEKPAATSTANVKIDPVTGWAIWPKTVTRHEVWKTRTGTGKTERFKKVIADWISEDRINRRTLAVAPTTVLCGNLSRRLGVHHAKPGGKRTLRSGSIATCLAGLVSNAPATNPWRAADTLLIIDEAETQLQQMLTMLKRKRGAETLRLLKWWIANAGQVILADAHAGRGIDWILAMIDKTIAAADSTPIKWNRLTSDPHRFNFVEVLPTVTVSKTGNERTDVSAEANAIQSIINDLGKERRVAIAMGSERTARTLAAELREKFPAKNIQVVVGSKHDEDVQDLSEARLLADALIYTTAMGMGVSIDRKDWYHRRYAILGQGCPVSAHVVEQMIHRVRHPITEEILFCGGGGDPVTGERTTPEYWQKMAKARVEADQRNLKKWEADAAYDSDWRVSAESEQFGDFQCVLEAARYENGYRWVSEYLMAHHDVSSIGGTDPEGAKEVKDSINARKKQDKLDHAHAIAVAGQLSEDRYEEISKGSTKRDEAEAMAFTSTLLARVYGDAWLKADLPTRKKMAFDSEFRRAREKNTVFAVAVCELSGKIHVDAAYKADMKRNSSRTYYEHRSPMRKGKAVAALLRAVNKIGVTKSGSIHITNEVAGAALKDARDAIKEAGLTIRADSANGQHIRALSDILRYAGVTVRVHKRKVNKKTVRDYYLDVAHIAGLRTLAAAQIDRWLNPPEDAPLYKNKYPNAGASAFRNHFR